MNKKYRLSVSFLITVLLLLGWLFLIYGFGDTVYRHDSSYGLSKGFKGYVFAHKVLLKNVITGYEKERVLKMIKIEAAKPENKETELKIDDNSIIFGEIKFIFKDGKVINVE
jgi:hypothetical protein